MGFVGMGFAVGSRLVERHMGSRPGFFGVAVSGNGLSVAQGVVKEGEAKVSFHREDCLSHGPQLIQ